MCSCRGPPQTVRGETPQRGASPGICLEFAPRRSVLPGWKKSRGPPVPSGRPPAASMQNTCSGRRRPGPWRPAHRLAGRCGAGAGRGHSAVAPTCCPGAPASPLLPRGVRGPVVCGSCTPGPRVLCAQQVCGGGARTPPCMSPSWESRCGPVWDDSGGVPPSEGGPPPTPSLPRPGNTADPPSDRPQCSWRLPRGDQCNCWLSITVAVNHLGTSSRT